LLDDVTGGGWRLFVAAGLARAARQAVAVLAPIVVTVVDVGTISDDGTLARWLRDRGVAAVLVRPDAYVFGTAAEDVAMLCRAAAEALMLEIPDRARAVRDPGEIVEGELG
jgi:hypothetical protein